MVGYLLSAVFWIGISASAYWNDHALLALFFAAAAGNSLTAASLSSRMDNIDAAIDKSANRIWDEIAELKNRL
jgi:hypothetical protein